MILNTKKEDIAWFATFSSLKGVIIVQCATDAFLTWIIIVPGLTIVWVFTTESSSF